MQYDDDIAFQRAILANPADTTLKLVYADWLQDRGDPRAGYVRLQLQTSEKKSAVTGSDMVAALRRDLDASWLAFMDTLAQPFRAIGFQDGEPSHPFSEPVGSRGRLITFESQYCRSDDLNGGVIADLSILTSIVWWACAYGAASCYETFSFMCELPTEGCPLRACDVLQAIKAAEFQSEHIANLNTTEVSFPGYHPYTLNDEIHTDSGSTHLELLTM